MNQETNIQQDIADNTNMLNNGAVDTDIKSDSNLLNSAESTKEVLTEVMSIADEEARTGQKIDVGSPDDLYGKAANSYVRNMKMLNDILSMTKGNSNPAFAVSRKGLNKVINAILQLPQDGLPVTLNTDLEKTAFALGQRIIADRFLMTYYHISKEQQKLKQKESQTSEQTKQEGEQNEQQ